MHIEGIIYYHCAKVRRTITYYILSILWENLQPIHHDHIVLDSLNCIHAGQLQNCY